MAKIELKSIMKLTAIAFLLLVLCFTGACSQSPESGNEGSSKPTDKETITVPEVEDEGPMTVSEVVEEAPVPEVVEVVSTEELVPIELKLPIAMFVGTPQNIQVENLKKASTTDRPPFLAPKGTTNLALDKPVTSSNDFPIWGELSQITDGDKEATDGSNVELDPGLQYVTIDLEAESEIWCIIVWHYHKDPRVYYDVIVQVSDDPDFIVGATTVFNNDIDNSAGKGIGKDMHYTETNEGELIDCKGIHGRYVRLYSNGNTTDDLNHYIEVCVYGRPIK